MAIALVAAGFLAGSGFALTWAQGHTHAPGHGAERPPDWLMRLGSGARFQAIQRQFRGFGVTMAEVGYRYTELYFGGQDGNWDYAAHMIEEMRGAIGAGLERRPEHRKNAEGLFLTSALPPVEEAVKQRDPRLFAERMEALRGACTACHAAEGVPFIRIGVPTHRINPVEKP